MVENLLLSNQGIEHLFVQSIINYPLSIIN